MNALHATAAAPTNLRVENHPRQLRVLGIGEASPRLSWQIPAAPAGWTQQAYEIETTRYGSTATFVVETADQLFVAWPDRPLVSRERVHVRIRVQGDQQWSDWSQPVEIEVGLLQPADWQAQFMSPSATSQTGAVGTAAPLLAGTWMLPDDIVEARLYVSALGLYELSINGAKVGDQLLAPGWTSYNNRLRYQTYDVTAMLHGGVNHASALLGNGWFRGQLTWSMKRCHYGERLAVIGQLEVLTAAGDRHVMSIDNSWSARSSNISADDIYDGQTTDLRYQTAGDPVLVEPIDFDISRLEAPDGPPVRATGFRTAQRVWRSPSGKLLIDFGQNLVGWCRLTVRNLAAGHIVVLRHAEVLENEELGVRPLRKAKATDTFIVAGGPEETLEPCLTFHGFRFAEVDGLDDLDPRDISAVVVGSDMERTGWFSSSSDLLNQFHSNVVWGMRGNFVDVPTDCPQRDERLGWTGDIEVFSPTATYLYDSVGFLTSWLKDLEADQRPNGVVPIVIPDVLQDGIVGAAWGDAATIVPWVLYQRSGDLSVLKRQLSSMHRWVSCINGLSTNGVWAGGFQFGDWLDPTAPPHDALRSKADKDVIATAYLFRSAQILADSAQLVGDAGIASWAAEVATAAKAGFQREFVTASGRILSDAQTVYALALEWDLLETSAQRVRAAARLADLVRTSNFCIATGFVGTPLIADALTNNGYADVAYRMLLQTECPSWLYSVTMGATTVWERWDSMMPDGSINPGEMTSFNHYALGAVADWMHRRVGGLAPADVGYRRLRIEPIIGTGLDHATAHADTPYGDASAGWSRVGPSGKCTVEAVVPVGTTADVVLPDGRSFEVGHGTYQWDVELSAAARAAAPAKPSSVREVMDCQPAWERLASAAVQAELGGMSRTRDAKDLADRLSPFLDQPVAELPDILTMGGNDPGRDRFIELLGDLLSP